MKPIARFTVALALVSFGSVVSAGNESTRAGGKGMDKPPSEKSLAWARQKLTGWPQKNIEVAAKMERQRTVEGDAPVSRRGRSQISDAAQGRP
ncbi:MAG: hypothetical protein ACRETT_01465 [Steroidobacteraceae bacterium]